MKSIMIALALVLGVAAGGATLMSGQAHADASKASAWTNANTGGGGG